MIGKTLRTALVLAGLGLFGASANAGVINLVSGQGTVGGSDSAVSVLTGPYNTPMPSPIDFNLADYKAASVVAPIAPWTATIAGAQWDSVSPVGNTGNNGLTAIYAISFTEASTFPIATLSGLYAVDDFIGRVWLNGTLIINNTLTGSFTSTNTLAPVDISSTLTAGTNTLYIENLNTGGGPSGILFNLQITTNTVPEPTSLAMVGIAGLAGFGYAVRRKRAAR